MDPFIKDKAHPADQITSGVLMVSASKPNGRATLTEIASMAPMKLLVQLTVLVSIS
ncbi:hypothetical protein MQA17_25470 [Escherichia coli]|nr:hypothetical protein [Escherichia coli]